MKKFILLLFFLNSCSFNNTADFWNKNIDTTMPNFNNEYTFEEYKVILKKYSKIKEYPIIN